MRIWLAILLAAVLTAPPASAQEMFDDVDSDAYYADAVRWMLDEGVTTGSADGRFRPDDVVTRGETAVFLWRLAGEPPAPVHPFVDVTVGWQDPAIAWMRHADITAGATPTRFDPGGTVSRGTLALFMWRMAGEPSAPPHGFTDVGDDLRAPVSWTTASGVSTGVGDGTFAPEAAVSRGEVAVFLERLAGVLPAPEPPVSRTEPTPPIEDPVETRTPSITVSPSSPRIGERITVAGSGFDGVVLVSVGGEVVATTTPRADGTFETRVTIPAGVGDGSIAVFEDGAVVARAEIELRPAAPTIGAWFPILLIGLAGAGLIVFWRRSAGPPGDVAPPEIAVEPLPDVLGSEPDDARFVALDQGPVTMAPLGLDSQGPLTTLAVHEETTFGAFASRHGEVDHALIAIRDGGDGSWQPSADLGPAVIDAITVSGSDVVAVGARLAAGDDGFDRRPSLWHGSDLTSWLHVDLARSEFAGAVFDGVNAIGESLVLHGRAGGPRLWVGAPSGWRVHRAPGPIDTVAVTRRGLFVFGRDLEQRRAIVLSATEGAPFAPITHPTTSAFDASSVLSVVDFEGGIVAAGLDDLRGSAVVFVSDDGERWHRTPAEFDEGTGIEHLIAHDDRLVGIGWRRAPSAGRSTDLAIWTSVDSVTWSPVPLGELATGSRAVAATVAGDTVVVSGVRSGGHGEEAVTWGFRMADLFEGAATA